MKEEGAADVLVLQERTKERRGILISHPGGSGFKE